MPLRFFYLRLIGDRSIPESEFGEIQKDRLQEMQYWASELKMVQQDKALQTGIVATNNHYAGFGPGTTNIFKKMIGLPGAVRYENSEDQQASILDY